MSGNRRKAAVVIQARDLRVLHELGIMRIIDREFAKVVAGFGSTTRVNTRLLQLTRAGLINRFFVGTVSGGRKAVYTLTLKGSVLVKTDHKPISRSHGRTLVGDLLVAHQMHINAVYVTVKHRPLPTAVRFRRWRSFLQPITQNSRLVPDGYFELETPTGPRALFLEVDLGNQAMPVWERKTRLYLQFAISGDFARIFHEPQFRVLVITTSQRRLTRIQSVIAKQTDKVFWLADFETINRAGFWAPVWLRPMGDQRLSLV